jgi:hypothetical protein
MADAFNNSTPQFGTAEYVGKPGNDHCQFCHQPIAGKYYRVNQAMACGGCAEQMRGELAKDTHAAYMRALVYGIGAAIVGMILYATFEIMTGLIIGYVSLAVGWMVGTAMMKGSNGVGGRRYQITAVLLTYAAVSMAAIPIWIHYAGKHRQQQQQSQRQQTQQQLEEEQRQLEAESGRQTSQAAAKPRATSNRLRGLAATRDPARAGIAVPGGLAQGPEFRLGDRPGDSLRGHEDRRENNRGPAGGDLRTLQRFPATFAVSLA